jgi:hypothetical protein
MKMSLHGGDIVVALQRKGKPQCQAHSCTRSRLLVTFREPVSRYQVRTCLRHVQPALETLRARAEAAQVPPW